ncbi:MAG: hypothetical protein JSV96_14950 [Candidatus Aminicenantes bacterium]|nr:MAG: hypothetical protein JSV96_14950 [Candidatus Aminicenantes bacterium]
MLSLLRFGVIVSFLISVTALSFLVLKTFSFGKKPLYAKPRGDAKKGVYYAFGRGMLPWEKESSGKHLPSYFTGMFYHAGVFAALFYLLSLIFSLELSKLFISLLRLLLVLGFVGGLILLFKRILLPHIRKISCPDDFAANIIVDLFLIFAFFHTYFMKVTPIFFLLAIVMFLYIPVGKIRHCFFFFYTRILFGLFYGRRGVLPPKTHKI